MSKQKTHQELDHRSRQLNQQEKSSGSDGINSKVHGNRSKQKQEEAKKK